MNAKTKKELIRFFLITFAYSWLIWLAGIFIPGFPIRGLGLEVLGAVGPAVAALYLVGRSEGKAGLKRIAANAFGAGTKWGFLIFVSLLHMGLMALSRWIYSFRSSNLPESEMLATPLALIPVFIVMFLIGGGVGEEIGWRGYALDRIQAKYSALAASLVLGVFWIAWHLPVFFLPDTNQSYIPFWLFVISVIPLGVLMTWVYNNTNKSIFAAAFFHTIGNLANEIFRVTPTESSPSYTGFLVLTVLYYIVALVVTVVYGAKNLSRKMIILRIND